MSTRREMPRRVRPAQCVALAAVMVFSIVMQAGGSEVRWSDTERAILRSLSIDALGPPPPAPSNAYSDSPAAARLGKRLFFDPRLGADGAVSCATCHQQARYFSDGLPRARALGTAARNTPTVVGAAYFDWLYWDGRRDSLWSQALTPIEAAVEMGSSRVAVLRLLRSDPRYRAQYARLFGRLRLTLPEVAHASPYGSREARAAWAALPPEQRTAINTAFANVGKALAAFQRTLLPARAPFDRYVAALAGTPADSDLKALTADQVAGLKLFIDDERTQCLRCHSGPLFSNGDFHNIGSGNFDPTHLDFGRALGVRAVRADEFNCLGEYSDAAPEQCSALRFLPSDSHGLLEGAFRVPGLRGLAHSAPYFHDGSKRTLEAVLEHYASPPGDRQHELTALELDEAQLRQLSAFLQSLSAPQ